MCCIRSLPRDVKKDVREVAVRSRADSMLADGTGSGIHYFVERLNFPGDSAVLTLTECKQRRFLQLWLRSTHNSHLNNRDIVPENLIKRHFLHGYFNYYLVSVPTISRYERNLESEQKFNKAKSELTNPK